MAKDLDPIDYNIVRMLAEDARISYAELGRKVGLSPSAVAERIHQLEADKVILGYRALLASAQALADSFAVAPVRSMWSAGLSLILARNAQRTGVLANENHRGDA